MQGDRPKSAINMYVSPSRQFTKQLIISPGNKSAAEATDCFDTASGFRFIVHNKHMSRFWMKSSNASTSSFTLSVVGACINQPLSRRRRW